MAPSRSPCPARGGFPTLKRESAHEIAPAWLASLALAAGPAYAVDASGHWKGRIADSLNVQLELRAHPAQLKVGQTHAWRFRNEVLIR